MCQIICVKSCIFPSPSIFPSVNNVCVKSYVSNHILPKIIFSYRVSDKLHSTNVEHSARARSTEPDSEHSTEPDSERDNIYKHNVYRDM
jgi:hypothetical protein